MGPIDYTTQVADPFKSALQGFQAGTAVRDDQQQQLAMQAQQQQQQALQFDITSAAQSSNPAKAIAGLALKYPQLSEQFGRAHTMYNDQQKQGLVSRTTPVYAALLNGRPEIAVQQLRDQAEGARNSGDQAEADGLEAWARMIELDPDSSKVTGGLYLSSVMGADKFASTFGSLSQEQRANDAAPAGLRKAEADAATAEVVAGNASERATLEIEKIATDINVSKENSRIRAMEVARSKETNDLKREELQLKLNDARTARDEKLKAKGAEAETAIADVDSTIGILKDILGDEDTLREAVGAAAWRAAIPGTAARTMAGRIEQLQNAIASTNLDKLKGAMSDKDIAFLKNIATNLDRYQDEDLFIKELNRVFGALEDARERVVQKYGAAGTPAAEGATVFDNHPKYGKVTERRLRQIARKAGVSVDDAKAFLSNSTDPGQGATGEY